MELPNKKYQVIYADPPWKHQEDGRPIHYERLNINDLKKIPVKKITDKDCILFLWACFPLLNEALELMEAWKFKYKTVAFTWVKKNKHCNTPFIGMGKWTRANAEICLLGIKGNPKRYANNVSQVIISPIGNHSKKPLEVKTRIDTLCGDVKKIELFARNRVGDDWDYYGDELSNTIQKKLS